MMQGRWYAVLRADNGQGKIVWIGCVKATSSCEAKQKVLANGGRGTRISGFMADSVNAGLIASQERGEGRPSEYVGPVGKVNWEPFNPRHRPGKHDD